VAHRRVERSTDGLPNGAIGAALSDVREEHGDAYAHEGRPFEITQRDGLAGSPGCCEVVEGIDGGLRHPHVDPPVDGHDGARVAPLRRDGDGYVPGRPLVIRARRGRGDGDGTGAWLCWCDGGDRGWGGETSGLRCELREGAVTGGCGGVRQERAPGWR
jgi:hypothetical protein